MEKIRILIADDHPVFRDGIRNLLDHKETLEVVGEASDGEEAVQKAVELRPNVIVMDISMPKVNGIEAARQIKSALPATAILMLTAYNDESYILAALQAGVAGFLPKEAYSNEILAAVKTVSVGGLVLDQALGHKVLARLASTDASDQGAPLNELHKRELEVLQLVAKGFSNKEIAQSLFVSERTVQTHLMNIFRKLDVSSRTEAALHAVKQGWISLEDLP